MTTIDIALDIASTILLIIGVFFVFLGMVGLLRLPDVYNRLHATTKIGTLGTFGVMMSILAKVGFSPMGVKAITVGLFLFLTAPIAAHMIGRAAHRHGVGLCKGSVIDEYGQDHKK
ncbi:multisubunit sodium/proton antiporter, MrpG subunit [Methanococcoides vulcani]|uniref:Multisubunit sodium/proton antiporter, MrpG subunit n=1 Tax=Methanococcoides vulcani TaxID=1353158 RepID=A0A1I0BJB7_9EURY|nr:monovalent cation/H(+) antiporter subunit G [Methanococcoides vulcani]SET06728.1 multisubunit sodium/proton antiporter, MrpG subunit [Methanococcoides vulcani]